MVMGVSGVSVDFGFSILTFGCGAASVCSGATLRETCAGLSGLIIEGRVSARAMLSTTSPVSEKRKWCFIALSLFIIPG